LIRNQWTIGVLQRQITIEPDADVPLLDHPEDRGRVAGQDRQAMLPLTDRLPCVLLRYLERQPLEHDRYGRRARHVRIAQIVELVHRRVPAELVLRVLAHRARHHLVGGRVKDHVGRSGVDDESPQPIFGHPENHFGIFNGSLTILGEDISGINLVWSQLHLSK